MSRSGPWFPVWALCGFCLGGLTGFGAGYALGTATEFPSQSALFMATFLGGGGAAGGAVVGAVRDILAYLSQLAPVRAGPEADYRDQPYQDLPPAPPVVP